MKSRKSLYHRHRFPQEIIRHAVWLYYRFCLSFRDVEDLLSETDKLRSYAPAHREVMPGSVHGTMQNLFAIPRHLLRAKHYRTFRAGAFALYEQVACA
jgi:transposase-like protein